LDRRSFTKYVGAAAIGASAAAIVFTVINNPTQTVNEEELTIYSGRGESLIDPLVGSLEKDIGIKLNIRYGNTAELAATILEEGNNSPADLYFAQDAGALGALSKEGRLLKLSKSLLDRARTVDYNTVLVSINDLPKSIWGFTDSKWSDGKIGWAPTNGSFQSFITAFRVLEGDERTKDWLEGIMANEPAVYPKNSPIVEALGRGEIYVGYVNNYYLHRFQAENPAFPVAHHYTENDAGSMINIAGLGIVDTTHNRELAERFIEQILSEDAQRYFATETYEYPLSSGINVVGPQKTLDDITTPNIDLSDLDDLKGTIDLLQNTGVL
jgi:iron(III) transport system substrate-binding protein